MRTLLFIFLASISFAANVTITVDSKQISEGESVILTVASTDGEDSPSVELPDLKDFTIVSGPSQSSNSSYQFINGKMSSSSIHTVTWTLLPKRIGRLQIPAISVTVDGGVQTSNPIIITVKKRSKIPGKQTRFFIEATVDKDKPYRGEQVTLTYTLFTRVDISSLDEEYPQYKGFWKEELFTPNNLQLKEKVKEGHLYHSGIIKKIALFPTRSGKIEIDPMIVKLGVREGRRNDFSIFGRPSKQYSVATNTLTIQVQPLPENKTGSQSAVVGNWNISSKISQTQLMQDEAFSVTITINGTGNIKSVDILPVEFSTDLEVFEPKVETNDKIESRKLIGGSKTIEYVIIPRSSGKILLPSFILEYFNPNTGKWGKKKTKPYTLTVDVNEKSIQTTIGLSKEEVLLLGEDIRFVDENEPLWIKRNEELIKSIHYVLLLFAGVIFVFPFIYSSRQDHLASTQNVRASRNALKNANIQIDKIDGDLSDIYRKINQVIFDFINAKTHKRIVEYSSDTMATILNKHKVDIKISQELVNIMERGSAVRYALVSDDEAQKDISTLKTLMKDIDHDWL